MAKDDAFSRCHPIINFSYFLVVIGFTMFMQHPVFLGISFVASIAYAMHLNGVKKVLRLNCLFTFPGLIIIALLNPMFNHYGVTVLGHIESSGNNITLEAIVYGLVLGIVLFIVVMWFSCYNAVMTSDKFIYLFGRIIPALSLILSMTLRFVPRFIAELKVIRNGQKCAGRDVSNGKFLKKIKYGLGILSILITWALENAIETADSMRSRGYGLKGRTAFSIYRFDNRDKLISGLLVVFFVIFVLGISKGASFAQYNPIIMIGGFTIMGVEASVRVGFLWAALSYTAFALFCFTPLILDILEEKRMELARRSVGTDPLITYTKIYESLEI